MRKLFILFYLLSHLSVAQDSLKAKILGNWIKEEIRLADNSPVYDASLREIRTKYSFFTNDTVRITYNGKTNYMPYKVINDTLIINQLTKFKIIHISLNNLVIEQIANDTEFTNRLYQIRFISEKIHQLGFIPTYYLSQSNDTVYIAKPNILEPYFVDSVLRASDYIYQEFHFSEFRKGAFVVRFVITKNNQIKGIQILESTHPKQNKKLLKAVLKTESKWRAATLNQKPINVEVELTFDLGWSEKQNKAKITLSEVEKSINSNMLADEGIYFLEEKLYDKAIEFFNDALKEYPLNTTARFGLAAAYMYSRKTQAACKEYQELKDLKQEKAIYLYNKYCPNNPH